MAMTRTGGMQGLGESGRDGVDMLAVPHLPGYSLQPTRNTFRKGHTWSFVNGQRIEQREGLSYEKPRLVRAPKKQDTWRNGSSLPLATTKEVFAPPHGPKEWDELPAWDALDRHVLRFYAYFKEGVVESNLENFRLRKCILYYYLEDDTMHITEPRVDNSGVNQGTLVRRHRFPGADGQYIKAEDLIVGATLHVYGKVMHLVDCDVFTREYCAQALSCEQPAALAMPTDPFTETAAAVAHKEGPSKRSYEKLYREVMLGGGHINHNMQQFMECDRMVCRFFVVNDDLLTAQYERRPFTVLYFLSDDTLEIREQYPLNCGRDNFPIFFRRAKMPRSRMNVKGPCDAPRAPRDYVGLDEFVVGGELILASNRFYIYDADEFTRKYFDALGTPLQLKQDVRLPEPPKPRPETPPYTGYGSWADSMASVASLVPKVPKKDFRKMMANDNKVLRFTAKLADPKVEDEPRRFVLNFYLADDSLSIHEPPQRNLGVVTGKYLEKSVHLNQRTGRLFEPADLLPGQIVQVFNHEFLVLDMDDYTRKHLQGEEPPYPSVDLQAVLERLRDAMRQQFPLVREVFLRFDKDHNGVLTRQEFEQALAKFSFSLSHEEVTTLFRHFDRRQDGQVSYNEFCDALLDEDCPDRMLPRKPALDVERDPEYALRVEEKSAHREETGKVRRAVRELGEAFYKHVNLIPRAIKEFVRMTPGKTVTKEQIQAALLRIGYAFDLEDIERCVLFMQPNASVDAVDYVEFLQALKASYHDLAAVR